MGANNDNILSFFFFTFVLKKMNIDFFLLRTIMLKQQYTTAIKFESSKKCDSFIRCQHMNTCMIGNPKHFKQELINELNIEVKCNQ